MSPLSVNGLLWMFFTILMVTTRALNSSGFYPSRILLTGTKATSFLVVGNFSSVSLYLTILNNETMVPTPGCDGNNKTDDWFLTLQKTTISVNKLQNIFNVTIHLNRTLCTTNESFCCMESPCIVDTLQVSACENQSVVGSLLIQAAISANSTFTGTVSDNATVIPTQAYHPLGSCPCNLTAGACDVGCCCDAECNADMKALFNGFCYTEVFGGNVAPAFDQLCSTQPNNQVPDWFPFLCVQSSMNNSPFLGYFYQGSTVSPSQQAAFRGIFQTIPDSASSGYKQGNAILVEQNRYLTIPQRATIGVCERNAPVAYLQNFQATCVRELKTCSDLLSIDINSTVLKGNGGTVNLNVNYPNITNVNNYITFSEVALPQSLTCLDIIVSANYTFFWLDKTLIEINVSIITANITLSHQAQLIQKFNASFLSNSSSPSTPLSGNPGYLIGKPVIVANGSSPLVRAAMDLWKPVLDSSCSSAIRTPVLFGEASISGCLLKVDNEECDQLRMNVTSKLLSLVTAKVIAKKGNSNLSNQSEWVPVIYEEPSTPCTDCPAANVMCLSVPANMNIQIMTAVTGAVEGILQEEILAAKISFSTVNVDCVHNCSLTLPISTSVQFIKVPAQPTSRMARFQLNYTEYDCERNEVCWQQLAYPLTQYYTGEPHHLTLAKGMILVFFFIVTAVLGEPWNRIRNAWNNKL
ncbi:tectonic-2 [Bombina bombina]|uniref:tectonic-2 n=1 Tax=Bombina bombina TaxID=8345 RepID=UPI00235A68BB|nr:tectonic-2 [Bombina bombina]